MSASPEPVSAGFIAELGAVVRGKLAVARTAVLYMGGLTRLIGLVLIAIPSMFTTVAGRMRFAAVRVQMVRVGVRSLSIVCLVQLFIGVILALNLAPTLELYGQTEHVADVVGIAVLRELGPLITGVLISGYAGASIAAELGSMVENEEIKALRSLALDPVRFLIAPRVLASAVMMTMLTIVADLMGVIGGLLTAWQVLNVPPRIYSELTQTGISTTDYFTGVFKGAWFGVIIGALACFEGMRVQGGAEGVGRATTTTVVKSIVGLVLADTIFTSIFYTLGW
ncbi:MAG: ABC transporter permease [Phycisphaerales bacterium]|nr:ABC transporter permease [Phycisphaerales bacterium]